MALAGSQRGPAGPGGVENLHENLLARGREQRQDILLLPLSVASFLYVVTVCELGSTARGAAGGEV